MAHLNDNQYTYRREKAAARAVGNEEIAKEHGMTDEQAALISRLCTLRHELHCNMDSIVRGGDGARQLEQELCDWESDSCKAGLPLIDLYDRLCEVDTMDGLIYHYGENVPANHDSEEFAAWYNEEYERIHDEVSALHQSIECYLADIDKQYGTHWCPTGALRIY